MLLTFLQLKSRKIDDMRVDFCVCEPFLLAGTLPTLGTAIIKASLSKVGYGVKAFYPSLIFFVENKISYDTDILGLLDDIPVQIVDFLFSESSDDVLRDELNDILSADRNKDYLIPRLFYLRRRVRKDILKMIEEILILHPRFVSTSVTFGGYNFVTFLFRNLKEIYPDIVTVVGGSNCTIKFADMILNEIPWIDYVLCDETTESLISLVKNYPDMKGMMDKTCSSRKKRATLHRELVDFEKIPCPDFDDYFVTTDRLGIPRKNLTLPYETSRGCWWCEKKPCRMCGFYGVRHSFFLKPPEQVCRELQYLSDKYQITKIRMADLVNPPKEYIKKILLSKKFELNIFWELRPDIDQEWMKLMKSMGLTFAQMGLESLNTECLIEMNKGTTAIQNIYALILANTYKVDVVWNYLYGFPWDKSEWYSSLGKIIPLIFHLQPPMPRKVWINKYSEWYECNEREGRTQEKSDIFTDMESQELSTFFHEKTQSDLEEEYLYLKSLIEEWKVKKKKGFDIYIKYNKQQLIIVRNYEVTEIFQLNDTETVVYETFSRPLTVTAGSELLRVDVNELEMVLRDFCDKKIMLYMDGKYLALANGNSKYRWTRIEDQVMCEENYGI